MDIKIPERLELAADGFAGAFKKLDLSRESLALIAEEAKLMAYSGISEEELDRVIIRAASQHIKDDPVYDRLAARLFLNSLYREVLGVSGGHPEFAERLKSQFSGNLSLGIREGWLSPKLERFDWMKLIDAADCGRDDLFTFAGLETLARRYLMRDRNQRLMELPQYFWLRLAMGLSWNESEPDMIAARFYGKMSLLEYIPGGSTNVNAGSAHSRLSNCFIMDMEDDIDSIGKTVADVLKLSKATGGIGLSVTKLRASGSPISTNNTFSSGPIPFLHIIDSSIRAISRAGKKMGALCFYMENWHLDFQEYMDLKQNAGDDYHCSL